MFPVSVSNKLSPRRTRVQAAGEAVVVDTADMAVATEISREITTRLATASLRPLAMVHHRADSQVLSLLQVVTLEHLTRMLLVSQHYLSLITHSLSRFARHIFFFSSGPSLLCALLCLRSHMTPPLHNPRTRQVY